MAEIIKQETLKLEFVSGLATEPPGFNKIIDWFNEPARWEAMQSLAWDYFNLYCLHLTPIVKLEFNSSVLSSKSKFPYRIYRICLKKELPKSGEIRGQIITHISCISHQGKRSQHEELYISDEDARQLGFVGLYEIVSLKNLDVSRNTPPENVTFVVRAYTNQHGIDVAWGMLLTDYYNVTPKYIFEFWKGEERGTYSLTMGKLSASYFKKYLG